MGEMIVIYLAAGWVGIKILWRIFDGLVFHLRKPKEAAEFNYQGEWRSCLTRIVGGRILAKIPQPMPRGEAFQIKIFVYYSLGIYRPGFFMPMELEGFVALDQSEGGGSGRNDDESGSVISFKFKGTRNQRVEYVSTSTNKDLQISGGYRSYGPNDLGQFFIKCKTLPS